MTRVTDDVQDYERVAKAIRLINEHAPDRWSLEELGRAMGMSPGHLQRVFSRWAGVSPARFTNYLAFLRARKTLSETSNLLDASYDAGLSGPGRLHDLTVTCEAMSPAEVRGKGAGLELRYGFHASPFGVALVVASPRGVAGLAFGDPGEEADMLADMTSRWPAADWIEDPTAGADAVKALTGLAGGGPLHLVLSGTNLQIKVWEALLAVPEGKTVTYTDIATAIGRPDATRAVASAIGRNPVSYFIPCHRVLRRDGGLGGYHWGLERKQAMLALEYCQTTEEPGTSAVA